MNALQMSKLFIKRNSATILTFVGAIGVVATAASAINDAPKATKLLEAAKQKKGEELTKIEKVKTALPGYVPTIITGTATIACIIGANVLNKRQQAALMSAYALLDKSYKDYRRKAEELYGDNADAQIREEIAKEDLGEDVYPLEDNVMLFYDECSRRYFESTMEKVLKAQYIINRDLAYHGYATLNEFYDLLGIPNTDFGDILGWSSWQISECQAYEWIEFLNKKVTMEDGLECHIIEIITDPTPDFEDY